MIDGIKESRFDKTGTPVATTYHCVSCNETYERPDVLFSHHHNGVICSLCKTLEK